MDLLCLPPNPSFPADKTPCVCDEEWDGGPFLTFAKRKGLLHRVPLELRKSDPEPPYLALLRPTPQAENESFFQTWLFFGLLAEFFGLNRLEDETNLIGIADADQELRALYRDYVATDDGQRYITGAKLLLPESGSLIVSRIKEAPMGVEARLSYLGDCLEFTCAMINNIRSEFNPTIRYSIAALGELFTTGMSSYRRPPWGLSLTKAKGAPWSREYFSTQDNLQGKMIESGWCRSDVERIGSTYQSLNTMYFASRLRKPAAPHGHSECSKRQCFAAQINISNYKPTHIEDGCTCGKTDIDVSEVLRILIQTSSYPILRVEMKGDDYKAMKITVEEYTDNFNTPFVAIFHVWADGLGNPSGNFLQLCQFSRVAKLIQCLEDVVVDVAGCPSSSYFVWIDTLCCPVAAAEKAIALERITDVYRNAAHVLVLDSSLSSIKSVSAHPAELCLRIFASSAWMRRLWTLQEGSLAKSLYFQFADRPASAHSLLKDLSEASKEDIRYLPVWKDLILEVRESPPSLLPTHELFLCSNICVKAARLHGFFGNNTDEGNTAGYEFPQWPVLERLWNLQWALYFRNVTVPSDEPLCVATLLSLSMRQVLVIDGGEKRMAQVWKLLADECKGIAARTIFYVDNPLSLPGWRWAPRSLISSGSHRVMDVHAMTSRFSSVSDDSKYLGFITDAGLRVKFPGLTLSPQARLPKLHLHPWSGPDDTPEKMLVCRNNTTGKWFEIYDLGLYRTMRSPTWTAEEQMEHDQEAKRPLCEIIHSGKSALIKETISDVQTAMHLMVEIQGQASSAIGAEGNPLHVRSCRTVFLSECSDSTAVIWGKVEILADQVAKDDATRELQQISDHCSEEYALALEKTKQRMSDLMAEALDSDLQFKRAVDVHYPGGTGQNVWSLIPMCFSHNIVLEDLQDDQVWVVD